MLGSLEEVMKDVTKDLDMFVAKLNNHSKSVDSIEVKITKVKQRMKELVKYGEKAVNLMCSVGNGSRENIVQQFKEVNKLLRSADTEITMLKDSLSNLAEFMHFFF